MLGYSPPLDLLAALAALPFGLIVGSFANVVIYRLPLEQSIVFPSSRCPRCGVAIRPWQNIPLVSWVLLRGRCAICEAPISLRYPAVEALHGAGFALIVFRFGLQPFTLLLLLLFVALVVLAFIDWDHQILPDVITLPGILIGILGAFLPGALIGWKEAALAATLGYVAFFVVAEGYARIRGIEGLGQGDWKLAAMTGAFLGGQRLLLTVFLGSLSGLIYGLIQATRKRGSHQEAQEKTAEAAPPPPVPEQSPDPAWPPPIPDARGDSEALASPPVAEESPVPVPLLEGGTPEEPESIGRYKLPFGTFLAASAIFVLFFGDAVLAWYASFYRF